MSHTDDIRRRVAVVTPGYAPDLGGLERHVTEITRRLGRELEIEVLAPSRTGLPSVASQDGVAVRRFRTLGAGSAYPLAPGLAPYLAAHRDRYDLVHAHGYHALAATAMLATRRVPTVFTPHYHATGHTAAAQLMHRVYRPLGAAMFKRANRVICVSDAEAALVMRDFDVPAPRIAVIPNAADVEAIAAAEPFVTRGPVVLCAGRLASYKRVDRAIGAMPLLEEPFQLKITGAGPEAEALKAQAAHSLASDRVEFLGHTRTTDLNRWLRTAHVFVTMSEQEAFGMAALEALAAGAAVIASDIPAHREVAMKAGGPITLVPLDASPELLARAIRRAAVSREPRPVSEIPTWDSVCGQTLATYDVALRAAFSTQLVPDTDRRPQPARETR